MNKDQFHKLLENPDANTDIDALEKLVNTFPYFNAANIILAKVSHDKGSMFSNQKIKNAALYTSSRSQLKNYILSGQNQGITEIEEEEKKTPDASVKEEKTAENQLLTTPTEPTAAAKHETEIQHLRDEIQEVLHSLKGLEAGFREQSKPTEHTPKRNPLDIIKEDMAENLISQPTKEVKEDELTDQPLKFYVHSPIFGKNLKTSPQDIISEYLNYRPYEVAQKPDLSIQASIIEKFLESEVNMPRFADISEPVAKPDLSKLSTQLDDSLVSENMANIFIKQNKINRAIDIYEKLKLKNPEKSNYFAEKIEYLQSLNK